MRIQFRTLIFYSGLEELLQERLCLKKYVISLPAVIGTLSFPLGPYPKSDLGIDLYSNSTPIANMGESDYQISFNNLKKSVTSLSSVIEALDYPLVSHLESDLATNLYSSSTPIAIMDESDHRISFNRFNKFMISLSATIGMSGSPLGPRIERDLATDLYAGSTMIAIKNGSNCRISFRRL
jgi:hypothetical protein